MEQSFAVVTGASRGLGQSFARELARRKINLILMSLPGQGLDVLAADLERQFGVRVVFRETDLCSRENVLSAASWINEQYPVSILINNAGIGGTKKFEDASAAYIEKMIQLNVTATSLLTHQLLPNLQQQHYAHVLNVASIAALSPVGYKTVYPASKAFINFFSRGLNQELKGTNVSVSVVNPGAMATNPEISARINKQGFFGKLILEYV
ncbi:MAG: SDR family NAD(P)-dependent oxidoreductase [Phaeodactylibacter sp.]|nr:SDR family NAD(P)-dependent oxidoreductase [Phaeodactylibacter sp.]